MKFLMTDYRLLLVRFLNKSSFPRCVIPGFRTPSYPAKRGGIGVVNTRNPGETLNHKKAWVPDIKPLCPSSLIKSGVREEDLNSGMTKGGMIAMMMNYLRISPVLTKFYLLITIFTVPAYGQSFDALLKELSGSDADQVESKMEDRKEKADKPSPHSSAEITPPPEEDEFAPEKNIVTNGVTLQGLDKQTARVFIIDDAIGHTIEFGNLKIIVRHCEKAPLAARQESMAFVTISEEKQHKSSPTNLFSGWMFSSSPALSALDHPIYDVWVKECKTLK